MSTNIATEREATETAQIVDMDIARMLALSALPDDLDLGWKHVHR